MDLQMVIPEVWLSVDPCSPKKAGKCVPPNAQHLGMKRQEMFLFLPFAFLEKKKDTGHEEVMMKIMLKL